MADIDLSHARECAERAALEVGPRLREGLGSSAVVNRKSDMPHDVVTSLDLETEERLAKLLGAFDSGIAFYGEEFGGDQQARTFWLVDPIDGTGHFVRGLPMCTTMIALVHDNEVVAGVINNFGTGELYSAAKGQGATRNGDRTFSADRPLTQCYLSLEMDIEVGDNLDTFRKLRKKTAVVDVIACGFPMSSFAAGRIDGRIVKDGWGYMWDYAAGALIAKESGGVVANIGTDTYDYRNFNFIATGPTAFRQLTEGPDAIFPIEV